MAGAGSAQLIVIAHDVEVLYSLKSPLPMPILWPTILTRSLQPLALKYSAVFEIGLDTVS